MPIPISNADTSTLEARLTAARASGLGEIGDAASASGTLHAKLSEVLARLPAIGVASVQYGSIAMAVGEATKTASITSVDTTRSAVIFLGQSTNANANNDTETQCRVDLTNATTVTATRAGSGSYTATVSFIVVTFTGVVSLQQGTITIAAASASNTATITSVQTGQTVLIYQGHTNDTNDAEEASDLVRITLTNATTVTATRGGTTGAIVVGYVAVEF